MSLLARYLALRYSVSLCCDALLFVMLFAFQLLRTSAKGQGDDVVTA